MKDPRHGDMELLKAIDVERIYRRTDELELHRDWVIVPLNCADTGMEMVLPDGRILLRAPGALGFEAWLEELPIRLVELGLSRTPRRAVDDPNKHLTGRNGPNLRGTRTYLDRQPDLNVIHGGSLPKSPITGG